MFGWKRKRDENCIVYSQSLEVPLSIIINSGTWQQSGQHEQKGAPVIFNLLSHQSYNVAIQQNKHLKRPMQKEGMRKGREVPHFFISPHPTHTFLLHGARSLNSSYSCSPWVGKCKGWSRKAIIGFCDLAALRQTHNWRNELIPIRCPPQTYIQTGYIQTDVPNLKGNIKETDLRWG